MPNTTTTSDVAQLLLREIGPDRIQTYLVERLRSGTALPTRPRLVRALARLSGIDALPLLREVAASAEESPQSRMAAVDALARLFVQTSDEELRGVVTNLATDQLTASDEWIRSSAAIALVRVGATQIAPDLRKGLKSGSFGPLAEQEIRIFLQRAQLTDVDEIIPRVDPSFFVGRKEILDALANSLETSQKTPVMKLTGFAGVGKTTLAAMYARQAAYELKFWLSGYGQRDLAEWAQELIRQARLQLPHSPSPSTQQYDAGFDWQIAQDQIAALVSNRLALLVVDDFDASLHPDQLSMFINDLVARLPRLRCLMIARRTPKGIEADQLELASATRTESLEMVRQMMAASNIAYDPEMAMRIVETAQGVPLLLKLGVEVFKRRSEIPFRERREELIEFMLESVMHFD